MQVDQIDDRLSVATQIRAADVADLAAAGFRAIVCNRPDGEGPDQPTGGEIAVAAAGLAFRYLPIVSGKVGDEDAAAFAAALAALPGPALAYCRTGTRSATLWSLAEAGRRPLPESLRRTKAPGYDMNGVARRIANGGRTPTDVGDARHEVVIVGGAAGIAVAASLRARKPDLDVAIIDPADIHYSQLGWTMVGAGVFAPEDTARTMGSLIPRAVKWIKAAVAAFEPENDAVILDGCRVVRYRQLVVCPGLKLDWDAVEGLSEMLGRNGVTSNYRYDLAPCTWELARRFAGGPAVFTQPPMPIKCAGVPQKAMYLCADHWRHAGVLGAAWIDFMNAGGVLFGVKDYVPALMDYVEGYRARLNFFHNLVAIDGPGKVATFEVEAPETAARRIEVPFDMIHVCPPQVAPDFIQVSPLADAAGWVDVDPHTLRHRTWVNVWSLGDAMNAPNAKTAAAARKQAPTVAENLMADMAGRGAAAPYDGYGSCPLTVGRGGIVLAEFGHGGALKPSFPAWLVDVARPSRLAWLLKKRLLPPVSWRGMLRGREWMAKPEPVAAPAA